MRTTVDIPDAMYQRLKVKAAKESTSVKQLLLRGADEVLRVRQDVAPRLTGPLIEGGSGTLYLTNEMIDDLLHSS